MAIERSDVCVIMIDAEAGVTEQDTKVAGLAHEAGKACILAVNKWDAIEKNDKTMQEFRKKLDTDFAFMSYAPKVFISAKTGQRIDRLFEFIVSCAEQSARRITTGMLNELLAQATTRVQPPSDKGKRLKIFYVTQHRLSRRHLFSSVITLNYSTFLISAILKTESERHSDLRAHQSELLSGSVAKSNEFLFIVFSV